LIEEMGGRAPMVDDTIIVSCVPIDPRKKVRELLSKNHECRGPEENRCQDPIHSKSSI
jgi:hypothetical protein